MEVKNATKTDAEVRRKANSRLDLTYLPPLDEGEGSATSEGVPSTEYWRHVHWKRPVEVPEGLRGLQLRASQTASVFRRTALNRMWLTCPGFAAPRRDHQQVLAVYRGQLRVFHYPYALERQEVSRTDLECRPFDRLKTATLFANGLSAVCQSGAMTREFMQWSGLDEAAYHLSKSTRNRLAKSGEANVMAVPDTTADWVVVNLYRWYLWSVLALTGGIDNSSLFRSLDPRDRSFWDRNDQALQDAYLRRVLGLWKKSGTDEVEARLDFYRSRRDLYIRTWVLDFADPDRQLLARGGAWEMLRHGALPLPQAELTYSLAADMATKGRYAEITEKLDHLQTSLHRVLTPDNLALTVG